MPADFESSTAHRLARLEELCMHLQHEAQQMHDVLLDQQRRVAHLEARLLELTGRMADLADAMPTPPRDPLAEKPPHY